MQYCGNCGQRANDLDKFCPSCGAVLVGSAVVMNKTSVQTDAQRGYSSQSAVIPMGKNKIKAKRSKKKWFILAGTAVGIIAIAILMILLLKDRKPEETRPILPARCDSRTEQGIKQDYKKDAKYHNTKNKEKYTDVVYEGDLIDFIDNYQWFIDLFVSDEDMWTWPVQVTCNDYILNFFGAGIYNRSTEDREEAGCKSGCMLGWCYVSVDHGPVSLMMPGLTIQPVGSDREELPFQVESDLHQWLRTGIYRYEDEGEYNYLTGKRVEKRIHEGYYYQDNDIVTPSNYK